MKVNDLKIVYFGTPSFSAITLENLLKNKIFISAIITLNDISKNNPFINLSQKYSVPIYHTISSKITFNNLKKINSDVGVLFAFGSIIPTNILNLFPYGILNIHPSLLPKYRGPSPIQTALLNGENVIGFSIIKIDEQLDHGQIALQKKITVAENETAHDLYLKISHLASSALLDLLPLYINNKINLQIQNENIATYTKTITREDGKIHWNQSSEYIYRQFRALQPWPGIYTFLNNKRIKIIDLKISNDNLSKKNIPGVISIQKNNKFFIECKEGFVEIIRIQKEGKKILNSYDFIRGYKNLDGQMLQF